MITIFEALRDDVRATEQLGEQSSARWKHYTLRHFTRFCESKNIVYLEQITKSILLDYIEIERARIEPITINKKTRLIKKLLRENDIWNDSQKVKNIKEIKKIKDNPDDAITLDFLDYLASLPDTGNNKIYVAIMFLIYDSGSRLNETLNIKKSNIDFKNGIIKLKEKTKYKKERIISFNSSTASILKNIMQMHDSDFLFFNILKNRPIHKDWDIAYFYRKVKKATGIKEINARELRHIYASDCIDSNLSLLTVQFFLGHENLKTTLDYCRPNKKRALIDIQKLNRPGTTKKDQCGH